MQYKIIFTGKIADGCVLEKVKKNISENFKLDWAKVENLFSGKPTTVKNNVDRRTALKVKAAMEKAGALCRILKVKKHKHKPAHGKMNGIEESKNTVEDMIACPKCGFHQNKTEACRKCGVIFKKIYNGQKGSTGNSARENKAESYSILSNLPERKKRDWMPIVVLGIILTVFMVVFIQLIFLFTSDSSDKNNSLKAISEKLRSVENKSKPKEVQILKLEKSESESINNIDATVPQKSPIIVPTEKSNSQPASDLIAFYPFNGSANDESGSGNHGTVYGASPVEDRFGNAESAYTFDGVNDYVDIGKPLVSGDFTISFWLKSNGRQNRFAVPISQGNMSYRGFGFTFTKGSYNGFHWGTWKDKKVSDPHWGKSAWHTIDFNFPKDINTDLTWHHLTVTHKDKTVTVYRDGMIQGRASKFPINFGRFKFNIGRASGNKDFNHRSFNGVIDDIRIYNRALSEAEIFGLNENRGNHDVIQIGNKHENG